MPGRGGEVKAIKHVLYTEYALCVTDENRKRKVQREGEGEKNESNK